MAPGHVTAALPLTNQFQESREATPGGIWGRKGMPAPLLVLPHSTGAVAYCIHHYHSSDPGCVHVCVCVCVEREREREDRVGQGVR